MSPAKKPITAKPPITVPHTEQSEAEDKKNRQYLLIMIAASIVMVLVGGYFVNKLFHLYIRRTNEVKAQDQYIAALKKKKDALAQLQTNYQAITQKQANGLSTADIIYRAVPKHPDFKTLIGVIENISTLSGLKASISPTGSTGTVSGGAAASSGSTSGAGSSGEATDNDFTGNTPIPYQFSVSVTGPYDQILQFLQLSENSLRPINFQSMTLSGTSGTIQANITFATYYQGLADIANKQEPLK